MRDCYSDNGERGGGREGETICRMYLMVIVVQDLR